MDAWKNIRLELGSTDKFPRGSVSRGYLIRLPLDRDGKVDRAALALHPHRAKVRRYWSTEADETGEIVEKDGVWSLRCKRDRRILELDGRPVLLGSKVSIIEADGSVLSYNIASVN
jgi:hypothetical protein